MPDHKKSTHKYKTFIMGNLHNDLLKILDLQHDLHFSLKSYSAETSISERQKAAKEYALSIENPQNLPAYKLGRFALERIRDVQRDAFSQISQSGNGSRRAIYEIGTDDEVLAFDNFKLLADLTKQQSSDEFLKIAKAYGIKGENKSPVLSEEDEPENETTGDI